MRAVLFADCFCEILTRLLIQISHDEAIHGM